MKVKCYEELIVWQKAMLLAKLVYRIQKQLPKEEVYGLGDQMRRGVVSIPSNIAEGFGRESDKEFKHFLSIEKSDIYLVLIGNKYGYCGEEELSPTEQEFDKAQELGLPKLVMVRGTDNSKREEREARFWDKVSDGRVRVRFQDADSEQAIGDLLDEVRNTLRDVMLDDGVLSEKPFEDQYLNDVSLDDIDPARVAWFAERAVRVRKAKYPPSPSVVDVLRSLHLFDAKRNAPTKAGVLLFGRDVQGPFPSSAIKCVCYPGIEKRKPSVDMELVEGDLFQLADQAIAFVNRHLNHGVGVHRHGAAADDVDEIPNSVIAEAVNNAIAHRNYASIGSIQIEVYSDRIEVISPGRLHRAISVAELYKKHESFATNPRIARAMYQVKYIETLGTGLTDMLEECKAKGLKTPLLEEVSGRFRVVIWRNTAQLTLARAQSGPSWGPVRAQSQTDTVSEFLSRESFLKLLESSELGRKEVADVFRVSSRSGYFKRFLADLVEDGLVEYTIPEKPRSRLQKYRLTEKGRSALENPQFGL